MPSPVPVFPLPILRTDEGVCPAMLAPVGQVPPPVPLVPLPMLRTDEGVCPTIFRSRTGAPTCPPWSSADAADRRGPYFREMRAVSGARPSPTALSVVKRCRRHGGAARTPPAGRGEAGPRLPPAQVGLPSRTPTPPWSRPRCSGLRGPASRASAPAEPPLGGPSARQRHRSPMDPPAFVENEEGVRPPMLAPVGQVPPPVPLGPLPILRTDEGVCPTIFRSRTGAPTCPRLPLVASPRSDPHISNRSPR